MTGILSLQHCQRLSRCSILLNPSTWRVLSGASGRHFTLLPRNRGYTTAGDSTPKRSSHSSWETGLKVTVGGMILALGVYYVSHLEKVPETGRWRFMNTSPKFEFESAELSRKQYRAEFEHATLPTTHPLSRHVQRVVSRILGASNLGVVRGDSSYDNPAPFGQGKDEYPSADTLGSTIKWDVIVVNDRRIINAMATPGLIVVFTGILPLCHNEDGLAAVLAHEIGHIVARHTAERISSHTPIILFYHLLQLVRPASDSAGAIPLDGLQITNSQVQEHEADLIGLRLMSKACYNPQGALDLLIRTAYVESKIPFNRTYTHPSTVSRIKSLEEAIPEGYAIMATNPDCSHVRRQLKEFDDIVHAIRIDEI